jgi:hypothetical protein
MREFRVTFRSVLSIAVISVLTLCLPRPAAAQGNSQNKGRGVRPPAPAPSPSSAGQPLGTGIRNFGAWLDDSRIVAPRSGWAGFSVGYTKSPFGSQLDVPSADVGYGLSPRVQVGLSLPYYRASYGGITASGLGDTFVNAKVNVVDPTKNSRGFGLAVVPVVEIISGPQEGTGRWHWGLPVSAEIQHRAVRVYGAGGYFSRGALFASGAVEWMSSRGYTVTGTLTHGYSIQVDPLSDALGLHRQRTDASASVSRALTSTIAAYGGVGRTLSRTDANSTRLSLSGGVVMFFANSVPARPGPRR